MSTSRRISSPMLARILPPSRISKASGSPWGVEGRCKPGCYRTISCSSWGCLIVPTRRAIGLRILHRTGIDRRAAITAEWSATPSTVNAISSPSRHCEFSEPKRERGGKRLLPRRETATVLTPFNPVLVTVTKPGSRLSQFPPECSPASTRAPARRDETGRHAAGVGEARLGHGEAALGDPAGAAWSEAAAPRQAPHIGRAAGNRVDVAPPRMPMHGGSEQTRSVGMRRRAQHLRDWSAFDYAAGVHDRNGVGYL